MILAAADAKRRGAETRTLLHSPELFDGTLEELVESYVLPNTPSCDDVERFHEQLVAYLSEPDPLHLVRNVSGTERGGTYRTVDTTRFKATDNAPAWWVHAALFQGYQIDDQAFANVVETIPAHMFDIPSTSAPTASAAGWHIAHIFNVKDGDTRFATWDRSNVARRFVRNIHPCNYFLVPKAEWQRYGGDARVIEYFVSIYRELYGHVWNAFLRLAVAIEPGVKPDSARMRYSYGPSTPTRGHESNGRNVVHEYRASRLTFRRNVIEQLAPNESFRVVTPDGAFQMTKDQFCRAFPNVRASRSYRDSGVYNYPSIPRAAEAFRVK